MYNIFNIGNIVMCPSKKDNHQILKIIYKQIIYELVLYFRNKKSIYATNFQCKNAEPDIGV